MIRLWVLLCLFVAVQSIQSTPQTIYLPCFQSFGLFLPEWTYSIISTNSSFKCCAACEDDSDCNAWSWHSGRGLCGLKNGKISFGIYDPGYVSSEVNPPQILEYRVVPDTQIPTVECPLEHQEFVDLSRVGSRQNYSKAVQTTIAPDCRGVEGYSFVMDIESVVPPIRRDISQYECCRECAKEEECYFWNWYQKTRTCVMSTEKGSRKKEKAVWSGSIA